MNTDWESDRRTAIHLLRSGQTPQEVAQELQRSLAWVYKWQQRHAQEGWAGLQDRPRTPQQQPRKHPEAVRQQVRKIRSELEAEAAQPDALGHIGAPTIQGRLRAQGAALIPAVSSIERILRQAHMTHPRPPAPPPADVYPQVQPTPTQRVIQVDIYPKRLTGGQAVACFNALDISSRLATGQPYLQRRAVDAADFLLHTWQTLGLPQYTQVDNEGCFSGGQTHPYVLGRVLRLGLWVGTELVFSPVYHPESNGYVERFHREYGQYVWDKVVLPDFPAVQTRSQEFFERYATQHYHGALHGQTPALCAQTLPPLRTLPRAVTLPQSLPLTAGQVHFMRRVDATRHVSVLNVPWAVPQVQPGQGVWVTLELTPPHTAWLRVFDQAPDAASRQSLAIYPFPLKEPVHPLEARFRAGLPSTSQGAPRPHARGPYLRDEPRRQAAPPVQVVAPRPTVLGVIAGLAHGLFSTMS
jgi:putative transposase